jgi:hypothetical protein
LWYYGVAVVIGFQCKVATHISVPEPVTLLWARGRWGVRPW